MSKRLQRGSLQRLHRGGRLVWMGFYYDNQGTRRAKTLGTVADLSKTQASELLDALGRPVNEQRGTAPATFTTFVNETVLPAKRRQWKASTRQTTEERIARILIPAFNDQPLTTITRSMLQDFLDKLATNGTAQATSKRSRLFRMCPASTSQASCL